MHQTETPFDFATLPSKSKLVGHFVGKGLDELRTPAMIINRKVFAENCAAMHSKAREWGTAFRGHLKTHKVNTISFAEGLLHANLDGGRNASANDFYGR